MHRSQTDKWGDELLFLVCVLVPIYGISTFADAIVFNSIEFWTGSNPITLNDAGKIKHVKTNGKEATIAYSQDGKTMTIASAGQPTMTLEKVDGMVVAKDEKGNLLYTTTKNAQGEVVVYNKNLDLVKNYSGSEVDQLKEKFAR